MQQVKDVLILIVFANMIICAISLLMIRSYLWKRNLLPKWQLFTGFMLPFKDLSIYINTTKVEYGNIGIWFKLMIVSFLLMSVIGFSMIFLYAMN